MAVCWRWPVTEKGHDIAKLRVILQTREEQPLPETVASFVKTVQWQGRALKRIGTTVLIHCEDAEVVALIAMDKETTGLCLRAGDHNLVVRLEREKIPEALTRSSIGHWYGYVNANLPLFSILRIEDRH